MKKKLAVIIVCLFSLFAVGCADVSVNVLAYNRAGYNYRQVNIVLPQSAYNTLNSTYSLERYFTDLCVAVDCGYQFDTVASGSGNTVIVLYKMYDPSEQSDDFTSGMEVSTDRGFFFTEVSVEGKNPFDIIRLCENGEVDATYSDTAKIFFAIFNGIGSVKSIYEYYPMLEGVDMSDLELNFYYEGKALMTDDNADAKEIADYTQYYRWVTTYKDALLAQAPDVEFSYKVASSMGWYILAFLIAAAVVAILLIVRRKSRDKGKEAVIMTPSEVYYQMATNKREQTAKHMNEQKSGVFEEFSDKKENSVFEEFDQTDEVFEEFDNGKR